MPSPLGHFTVACIIYKSKKTLSLSGLIIGSIVPDIDTLFYYVTRGYVGRELLHSFVGAGALGTLISTPLVVLFYPLVVSTFFGINKEEVRQVCKLSKNVFVSSFVGGLSHILIDSTCHNYNPLLYPFTKQSVDILLFTHSWKLSYFVVELLLMVLLVMLMFGFLRKRVQGFWKQILVGG